MSDGASMRFILELGPALPVLALDEAANAAPLAKALSNGGIKAVELTLRGDGSTDVVKAVRDAAPNLMVGVGMIRTPRDVEASIGAGASFLSSPGAHPELLSAMAASGVAALPGVATPSEAMAASEAGLSDLSFFPADAGGGVAYLKALAAAFPHVSFRPTGGVKRETAGAYLALANVACVGADWIAPPNLVAAGDWGAIEANAWAAAKITADPMA